MNIYKKSFFNYFIISFSLIIIILLSIFSFHKYSEFVVHLNNEETNIISFKKLNLIPGEKTDYLIVLKSKKSNSYNININFNDIEINLLKDYLYIRLECQDQIICEDLVYNIINNNGINFKLNINKNKPINLDISYYISEDAGNEIQNESAIFELVIESIVEKE